MTNMEYKKATAELVWFDQNDIISTSGGKPGHGYGDKNHDHIGPPGQNKP